MRVLLLAATAANAKQFCTRTVAQCRADYPELLGRIDRDLAPWHDSGITAGMASRRRDELRATNAKLDGYVTISGHHGDNIVKGVGGYHGRAEVVVDFVKAALARHCDVPLLRQPFYYTTSDHVPKDQINNASADPKVLAPLATWCRRSNDSLSALAPEGSFWADGDGRSQQPENATAHGARIRGAAKPWANRSDAVWFRGTIFHGGGSYERARAANYQNRPDLFPAFAGALDMAESRAVSPAQQCVSKYVLYLHGSACSGRLKNLLKCGSVVVFPEHAGGLHNQPEGGRRYGDDVRYEEFFYDRLEPNVTIYRPDSVDDLADAVAFLRSHDEFAREVGRRSQAFALRELGADAALCYWAALVAEVARLQDRGDRLARCCPDG